MSDDSADIRAVIEELATNYRHADAVTLERYRAEPSTIEYDPASDRYTLSLADGTLVWSGSANLVIAAVAVLRNHRASLN